MKCRLQIDMMDPNTRGANSFLGCVLLEGKELRDFLAGEFLTQSIFQVKRDDHREAKGQKIASQGRITISGGEGTHIYA